MLNTAVYCAILTKDVWYPCGQGEKAEYSLERLQSNCHILLQAAADSKEEMSKVLFLNLINDLYRDIAADYIHNEKGLFRENNIETSARANVNEHTEANVSVSKQTFKILNESNFYEFFSKIFSEISIRTLARTISISDLLYNIQITDLALFIENVRLRMNNNSIYSWKVDCSITDIQQFIGSYLRTQASIPGITVDNYSQFAKNCILENWRIDSLTTTVEAKERLRTVFSYENAVYMCGLIDAGMCNLAKDVFSQYLKADYQYNYHYYYYVDDFIFIIAPFCYLYYLGFWEEDRYVNAEIRKQAQWLAKELSKQYKELLRKKMRLSF